MREHNLRAVLLAGLSLTVLANIQPASARNDFWQPFFRDTPYRNTAADIDRDESKKKPKKKADTAGEKKAAERAATIPSGPLHIVVSIDKQRVTLFADGKPFANAPVSTGTASHPTPTGIFSIIQKNKHHVSNLYDAPMPYMQRITWSGVAMHTGPLPGYAASHGCVRLPNEFAQMLWKATKIGARVIVARPEVAVAEIEHPNLFARRMTLAQKSASLNIAEVQQAMAQAAPQIPLAEPAAPRPAAPVRLADGAKLVPGAIIGDSVQPVGSVGMVYRPEAEAAKLAAAEEGKVEEPAVEIAATPEPQKTVEAKPVETKPAEPVKVAEPVNPVEPAKPVEITTSIQIIKDEPGAKKPEVTKAPEPAKPAVIASPTPAKPAIEERAAAVEVMPTAKPVGKSAPVSVFVSRKEAKLYVRQGMEPVFDTPVTIKDADKPIGTHVYTAMSLKDDGASMRWTVVSVPSTYPRDAKTEKNDKTDKKAPKHDKSVKAAAVAHTPEPSAKEALDRLDIAPDTFARIEAMMTPGSSLIVSDNKLSDETGKGTDFIVLTR